MAYIIDKFNRYDSWARNHARFKFEINGQWYAILEVELEWGVPKFPLYTDHETHPHSYFIYNEYKDALEFALQMKSLN